MEHLNVGQPLTMIDRSPNDDVLVEELLQGTSRTFALAIPLLSGVRRQQIGLAYLLFRVADSIEDAPEADIETRIRLLNRLQAVLADSTAIVELDSGHAIPGLEELSGLWPTDSATHELLMQLPRLLRMLQNTTSSAAAAIRSALNNTIHGMARFMEISRHSTGQLRIETVSDLQSYCYVVAGIVGEMLTDLFVAQHTVSNDTAASLRTLSVGFGECLQLTNILKDADGDALDGRVFIPAGTSREAVLELAYRATRVANEYICLLESNEFPADVVAFCRFLYLLAEGTLNQLQASQGSNKLTRDEVMQMLKIVQPPAVEVSV